MNRVTRKQQTIEHVKSILPRKELSEGDLALIEMLYDLNLLKGVNEQ